MNISNNKKQFRFEGTLPDEDIAYLEYRWLKGNMVLMRTWVPTSGREQGIGSKLIEHTLQHAHTHGLHIIPYCSFVVSFIKEHPQYLPLVAPGHQL